MSRSVYFLLTALSAVLLSSAACDSQKDPVTSGREAVKEIVTQPFKTLEGAKDSLKQSEDRTKAALEEFEKSQSSDGRYLRRAARSTYFRLLGNFGL